MSKKRMNPRERAEAILQAAVEVATASNYRTMSRDDVAARAVVEGPLVTYYFKNMDELKRQVMQRAIENQILVIIAHGVVNKDPIALGASKALRNRALRIFMGA